MKSQIIHATLILVTVFGFLGLSACSDEEEPEPTIDPGEYVPSSSNEGAMDPIPFTDVTDAVAVSFVHQTGGFQTDDGPSRYLPECMGPGVVLFDADGDGDQDLFIPNGANFPGRTDVPTGTRSCFLENVGPFQFKDRTEDAGLGLEGVHGLGGAAADMDGDGDNDLLVTSWGGVRLMRNDGNLKFQDVTEVSSLKTENWKDESGNEGPDWSTSVAIFDVDKDQDLDIFVCNYAKWCPENDVFDTLDGTNKSFAIPKKYESNSCRLFRNVGEGRFEDVTTEMGIYLKKAKSLGVALWDFNEDGTLDVVVANDTQPNFLFLSAEDGTFEECGLKANIAYDEDARVRAGMGIAAGDYRNDGTPGIPIGNFSGEPVALYRKEGAARFRDVTQQAGVAGPTQGSLTFGVLWVDTDLDGYQDLVLANGHLEPEVQKVQGTVSYAQRMILLRNEKGTFKDWSRAAGPAFDSPLVARGLACADLDDDGDLDLVVGCNGGPVRFLRNDQDGGNSLRVTLKGKAPNANAIGAMIEMKIGDTTQRRLVHTGSSYASQSEFTQTFGLGSQTSVTSLRVLWPDGSETTRKDLAAGNITIEQ